MGEEETSVRVAVRIRPQSSSEVLRGCGVCARADEAEGGVPAVALGERSFAFDFVFDERVPQAALYACCVRPLLQAALDGYNATVLAYGQTGSGKTYTMGSGWEPDDDDDRRHGIIPRAVRDLYAGIDERRRQAADRAPPEFCVRAQFIELYNEDIVDLLDPAARGLRVAPDDAGGVRVLGASAKAAPHADAALAALRAGALARSTAATAMNTSSSRSHAVFSLLITQRRRAPAPDLDADLDADPDDDELETLAAKVHFVDLAGSERLKRTGATGERAREGISINCGLLALGNVISALGDRSRRATHVPYRDSKLTRLLQDSLGGNSRTVMIACVSPSDGDFMETLNTLKYSHRARNIQNRCVLNQDVTSRTIRRLRRDVARLQLELTEFRQGARVAGDGGWSDAARENQVLRAELEALRARADAARATSDRLAEDNARLRARAALAPGAPAAGDDDCALAGLVAGYVREIEELRSRLLEAAETERRRRPRARAPADPDALLGDARRELDRERDRLAALQDDGADEERAPAEGRSDGEDDDDEDAEARDERLAGELAALGEDIDTKARLVEQLEQSQRRLADVRERYERRLSALHRQIRAAEEERDRAAAAGGAGGAGAAGAERRLARMSREARRLGAARVQHEAAARGAAAALARVPALREELAGLRAERVRLMRRLREDARAHARDRAASLREVAQLRKESRRNANVIRSLEADRKLKDQVLRRKQEEVSLLRRSQRGRGRRAGEAWPRVARWLERAAAARALAGDLEARLEHALREREGASDPDHRRYARRAVDDAQRQIVQLEEESVEAELAGVVAAVDAGDEARDALERMALLVLRHAGDAARAGRRAVQAEAALRLARAAADTDRALAALREEAALTRPVSPASPEPPASPPSPATPEPPASPLRRRGSVRLRELGVIPREAGALSRSLHEAASPAPLVRVPSAPGSLKAPRHESPPRSPPGTPPARAPRREPALARPSPASDVFSRLSRAPRPSPPALVRPLALQRRSSGRAGAAGELACALVAEGHAGAVLALAAAGGGVLYSGGSDGTVRCWDMAAGREVWRAEAAGAVASLARGAAGGVLAAGAGGVRLLDDRAGAAVRELCAGPATCVLSEPGGAVWGVAGGALWLWDARGGRLWRGAGAVGATCAALCEGALALGSRDHWVRLLRPPPPGGAARVSLRPPHYDGVTALLATPGGALLSASRDMSLKLWDPREDTLLHSIPGAHRGWVTGLAWWPAGGGVASCGRDGGVRLWGDATGSGALGGGRAPDPQLAVAASSDLLYTGGGNGDVRAWRRRPRE